jgi:hypothetical protein
MPTWFLNGVVWVCAPLAPKRASAAPRVQWFDSSLPAPAWSLHFVLPHLRRFRRWWLSVWVLGSASSRSHSDARSIRQTARGSEWGRHGGALGTTTEPWMRMQKASIGQRSVRSGGDLSIWPHDTCGHLVGSKKSTSDAIHEMSLSNLLVLPSFFTWSVRVLLVFLELTRDGGEKFFYVMCTLHSLSFTASFCVLHIYTMFTGSCYSCTRRVY